MRPRDAGWLAVCAAVGLTCYAADRAGIPFCGTLRHLFHTETLIGRVSFGSALTAAGVGFYRHVAKRIA
jgi:hypothetical protein